MLLLGGKTFTAGGVTVFGDHADPAQFWYLPAPVALARRGDEDAGAEPQLLFIKYKPAVVAAGVKGGGFLLVTVALPLSRDAEQELRGRIMALYPGVTEPRLAPVPFDDGTVQCIALDVQGPGGTAHAPTPEGAFVAVEQILGATTPSLYGDQEAAFGLTLSQEGAVLLERAFDDDQTPVGAIYQLRFTGVRPALDVRITADLKRCYDAFSIGLTAEVYWVSVGIDLAFEKLKQDGAIKVEVLNLTTDEENRQKEQWALDFFKEQLVADWFRPRLSPATAAAAAQPPAAGAGSTPALPTSVGGVTLPSLPGAGTGAGAGAGGGGRAPSGPYSVALRLRYVQQEEQKTVTIEYNRTDAVQRSYAPQGFFGVLLRGLDREKHFRAVDLDDPFFRVLSITVTPPRDFDSIGLLDAHVALDYGDAGDPLRHKHGELVFDAQNKARTKWEVYKNPDDDSSFTYRIDYHFDPQSGWDGEKLSYSLPAQRTEDQELYVNPFEILGFLEIHLRPGRIDWNAIDYIEVALRHESSSGWIAEKLIELRADAPPGAWKLRLADKRDSRFTWQATAHLQSGQVLAGPTVASHATAIVVEDPFVHGLNLILQPALDPAQTKVAYIDTAYEDPDVQYLREDNVALEPGAPAARLRIPVLDPKKRAFRYRVTLIGPPPGNQVRRGAWTTTEETLLLITDGGAV